MGGTPARLTGSDLAQGCEPSEIPQDGSLTGHAHGEAFLPVRQGGEMFALAATCAHSTARSAVEGVVIVGDRLEVAGTIARRSCLVACRVGGRIAAVATIQRDQESLRAEALLGRGDRAGLEALLADVRG